MSIQNVMVMADIAARRRSGVMAALVMLVVLLVLISLGVGPVRLSPVSVIDALFGGGSDVQQVIVREIRLPRTILGFAIGAMLGLSGAAMQGLLRNPLAAPELFGAPQSAAFGAVLVIAFGLADVRSYALPVAAIAAAFASVFALLAIAGRNAGLMVISGVALGVGGAVAVSGSIGFIGLVAPHLMRPLVGHDPARLLVPSALTGAALLLAADIAVRIIPSTSDIKVGVLTSIIGVPFFLYLIMRERRALGGGVA